MMACLLHLEEVVYENQIVLPGFHPGGSLCAKAAVSIVYHCQVHVAQYGALESEPGLRK